MCCFYKRTSSKATTEHIDRDQTISMHQLHIFLNDHVRSCRMSSAIVTCPPPRPAWTLASGARRPLFLLLLAMLGHSFLMADHAPSAARTRCPALLAKPPFGTTRTPPGYFPNEQLMHIVREIRPTYAFCSQAVARTPVPVFTNRSSLSAYVF